MTPQTEMGCETKGRIRTPVTSTIREPLCGEGEQAMNFAEFDANDPIAFTAEMIERRRREALGTKGASQLQWLASKVFPMMRGKSIDACFLVSLFLLTFSLRVMQDREDAGVIPT